MACFLFVGLIHAWKDWMKERVVVVETKQIGYGICHKQFLMISLITQLVKFEPSTKNRIGNGSKHMVNFGHSFEIER